MDARQRIAISKNKDLHDVFTATELLSKLSPRSTVGLPIQIRDAALHLVAQGPNSHLNRGYYAQNMEKQLN
jgi:hypothetical protein